MEITKTNDQIQMHVDTLEHIMACMANQKFISAPPTNGDSVEAALNGTAAGVRLQNQEAIDKCYSVVEKAVYS